jgi:hypothetical protein
MAPAPAPRQRPALPRNVDLGLVGKAAEDPRPVPARADEVPVPVVVRRTRAEPSSVLTRRTRQGGGQST